MTGKNGYYMNEKVLKCLYDIKNAIDEIDTILFQTRIYGVLW